MGPRKPFARVGECSRKEGGKELRFAPLLVATYLVAASLWLVPSPTPSTSPYDCAGSSYRADTTVDYIRNGGFESGLQSWMSVPGTNPPTISSSQAHSG